MSVQSIKLCLSWRSWEEQERRTSLPFVFLSKSVEAKMHEPAFWWLNFRKCEWLLLLHLFHPLSFAVCRGPIQSQFSSFKIVLDLLMNSYYLISIWQEALFVYCKTAKLDVIKVLMKIFSKLIRTSRSVSCLRPGYHVSYGCTTACWRSTCCWVSWGSMSTGDPNKKDDDRRGVLKNCRSRGRCWSLS